MANRVRARFYDQLLQIMSSSIAYLTSRANFVQVSADIPVTKSRNPDKVDAPDVFEGALHAILAPARSTRSLYPR